MTKLLQLQQIQRDQRAAQQLIDSTTGPSGGRFAGATQALAAVSAVVTDRTALMLVDLTRSEVTLLTKIELNTRSGGGGNGGATVISPHFYFTAKLTEEDYAVVRDRLIQEVDEAFGNRTNLATLHSGSVGRH